jgi:hypothetical protein
MARTTTKRASRKVVAKGAAKSVPSTRATKSKPAAAKARTSPKKPGDLIEDQRKKRLRVYTRALGKPVAYHRGEKLGERAIDVAVFKRDIGGQSGFALLTNGMSDRRVPRPKASEAYPQTELVWFTRDADDAKVTFLHALSQMPFEGGKPFMLGGFASLPAPPVVGCAAKDVMFLRAITPHERVMHTDLALMTGYFELLVVHLLAAKEHKLAKASNKGFNAFLDLLDKNEYPLFFDPTRRSYV